MTGPESNDNILFIGKLTESKGCYTLVRAFNYCAEKNSDIQLRLAGKGDEMAVKALIDPRFIDRVHFIGYCDRERIKYEIDNCSFACIPSYFENFSMVPLEIMARRKTIIYTLRTSGREIIDDGCDGFTVNPEEVSQVSEKIMLLVNDHTLRDELALRAYKKIEERFSMAKIMQILDKFYSGIIQ